MNPPAPPRTLVEQSVSLAGALAERGVQHLVLIQPDQAPRPLTARDTDLPGVLAGSAEGTRLEAGAIGLVVRRDANRLVIVSPPTDTTRAIVDALA